MLRNKRGFIFEQFMYIFNFIFLTIVIVSIILFLSVGKVSYHIDNAEMYYAFNEVVDCYSEYKDKLKDSNDIRDCLSDRIGARIVDGKDIFYINKAKYLEAIMTCGIDKIHTCKKRTIVFKEKNLNVGVVLEK